MRQDWEPEDLIEVWTLLEDDMKKVRNKSGATRLGFALLLKFFEVEARFPESAKEMPAAAVEYVAQQVKVPAGAWADYDWQGDRIKRHRKEIREAYGFRANTEEDQDRLAEWLAAELCPVELSRDRLAAAVVAQCRNGRLELPADLFADVSEKLVDAWRARASKEYPANLERMKPPRRLTLLAALCHVRQTEITDSLVDLFIQLVLKINTRAERKVDKELNTELKKVRGKEGMLLRVAEAALSEPSGHGAAGDLPGGRRGEDAEGAGGGGRGERGPLQGPRPYCAAVVVLGALAPDALAAAGRAGAEVQQHCLPAGDGRDRPAPALPGPAAEGGRVLRSGGERAACWGGARALVGGGGGRQGTGRAHPVRAVRAGRFAGRGAAPGDLGGGGEPVAQPGGRPAGGLRGQPGRALRRAGPAAGRRGVHRRPARQAPHLAGPLRAGAGRGHDGRGGDRQEARRAVDQGLPAR
ncbi:DUF4158 domain-containing protein [Sphaerisporangium perillae]|uniref:DUF4158 domain-containing protein n=1 Tax=Sphaerisporangium perillae TaxID=2935860 RepID=UPI003FD6DEED